MTLEQRGIDSEQEWGQYIATVEKDGELVAQLCDILNTDVLQIVNVVKQMKQKADGMEADNHQERDRPHGGQSIVSSYREAHDVEQMNDLQTVAKTEPTGVFYERSSKHYAGMSLEPTKRDPEFGNMGRALENVNILESSDEDKEVRHVIPIMDVVKDTKARAESCEAGTDSDVA
ncbi:hypothetical protein Y032_0710g1730 [Ancylostoma ceylanicum]|nr:hypothetical protein Y032_0710g1730 [Ancylostoma ceylanicum]